LPRPFKLPQAELGIPELLRIEARILQLLNRFRFARRACACQHRYLGDSVPYNDSSTEALAKYLSVEQNLADIAALMLPPRPAISSHLLRAGWIAG